MPSSAAEVLAAYEVETKQEAQDVERIRRLLQTEPDPWSRATPLHLTASALIVHPASGRVLLRWHERQQALAAGRRARRRG